MPENKTTAAASLTSEIFLACTLGQYRAIRCWLVYLLNHSLIADAHRPEFGPLSMPGNLAFIEADGSLRPGHDVFNEF